jgi:hypothetical protein
VKFVVRQVSFMLLLCSFKLSSAREADTHHIIPRLALSAELRAYLAAAVSGSFDMSSQRCMCSQRLAWLGHAAGWAGRPFMRNTSAVGSSYESSRAAGGCRAVQQQYRLYRYSCWSLKNIWYLDVS